MALGIEFAFGKGIGEKGASNGGLADDLILEDPVGDTDGGDEATGVDFEIPGLAGAVEWDDYFFVGEGELAEGYSCAMSPRAEVAGVESDCEWCFELASDAVCDFRLG